MSRLQHEVAIVSYARTAAAREDDRNEIEIVHPVVSEALSAVGLTGKDMGFTVSGSSDYLAGQPFSFVNALDSVGAWPPINESHVEMDGAWALYEAVLRLQHGDIDTALVYCFGKSSPGELPRVLSLQLDPYNLAPLWPDAISLAGLQARAGIEAGLFNERDMAEVVARSMGSAEGDPMAQRSGARPVDDMLAKQPFSDPLRKHDCAPIADGAAAMVLAIGDRARELSDNPIWIKGIDHRIEAHQLGLRDLTDSVSTRQAAEAAGVDAATVDIAEIHAPFSSQELILRKALGLTDKTTINPSGGALASNPVMVAGLDRFGQAFRALQRGDGDRAIAHATSGPALQQNLVGLLER